MQAQHTDTTMSSEHEQEETKQPAKIADMSQADNLDALLKEVG